MGLRQPGARRRIGGRLDYRKVPLRHVAARSSALACDVPAKRFDASGIAVWAALTAAIEVLGTLLLLNEGELVPAALVLLIALATSCVAYVGFRQMRE